MAAKPSGTEPNRTDNKQSAGSGSSQRFDWEPVRNQSGSGRTHLEEEMLKSPPSTSRTLQNRTPLTNGTAASSSRTKWTWNLNFFFLIRKAMIPREPAEPRRDRLGPVLEEAEFPAVFQVNHSWWFLLTGTRNRTLSRSGPTQSRSSSRTALPRKHR